MEIEKTSEKNNIPKIQKIDITRMTAHQYEKKLMYFLKI